MKCKHCGSENVTISIQQVGAKTRTRRTGCLWSIGRCFLIFMTGGLWLLIGKRKGTSNTKFKNVKVAICQDCGHSWNV